MAHSSPFEMLTDASGSVSFGWAADGVYYARFGSSLSARLGEVLAERLRVALSSVERARYFADASGLQSYELTARRALLRVFAEQRHKLSELNLLWWNGPELDPARAAVLGQPLYVTKDAREFERRLLSAAPSAKGKLGHDQESKLLRARWPLRR